MTSCDEATQCEGFGPGIRQDDIIPFDRTPELIEARLTREGLLSYDSLIEESLTRAMECVLDHRVRIFKELCEDCGPDCQIVKV